MEGELMVFSIVPETSSFSCPAAELGACWEVRNPGWWNETVSLLVFQPDKATKGSLTLLSLVLNSEPGLGNLRINLPCFNGKETRAVIAGKERGKSISLWNPKRLLVPIRTRLSREILSQGHKTSGGGGSRRRLPSPSLRLPRTVQIWG